MEREIKFKFLLRETLGTKEYLSPLCLTMEEITNSSDVLMLIIEDGAERQGNVSANDSFYDTDWEIYSTCQYTGLKDKNSVEIYEGDIVRIINEEFDISCISRVEFKNGMLGYQEESEFIPLYMILNISEVIGNIYENKELLNA